MDASPSHWNAARVIDLVLSGGNPVIVGCVVDTTPTDHDRLFSMREYSLGQTADTVWTYQYDGGQYDDDGYAIIRYETDDTPPEERFVGVGFDQVDLGSGQQSTADALSIGLDEDGDTFFAPYTFSGTWYDACARDVSYIGALGSDDEVYAVCGWYDASATQLEMRGFLELAHGSTQVQLIEDSSIEGSWERIINDAAHSILVMGGFRENSQRQLDDLRVGYVDISSSPYSIDEQSSWGTGSYEFVEGPLVRVSSGLYIYLGNGADDSGQSTVEAVAVTFWSWHSAATPKLTCDATKMYTNDSSDTDAEFADFTEIAAFSATYRESLASNEIVMLVGALDDHDVPCILVTSFPIISASRHIGALTIHDTLTVTGMPLNYSTAEPQCFEFTSKDPVEGIGGGLIDNNDSVEDCRFWIFEIEDS
jgi:hypothetical protein